MKTLLLFLFLSFTAQTGFTLSLPVRSVSTADKPKPAPEVTLMGVLEQRVAIGGETTGWSLRIDRDQRVDLLLPVEAFGWISPGLAVAVKGRYGTRKYPERGEVRVFIVREISQIQT